MLNCFTLVMAHLGHIWVTLRMQILQVVLLFSVTFLTTGYMASISTNQVSIDYPKVYDTYESLTSAPTIIDLISLKFFQNTKFQKSQVEHHMQQSSSRNHYPFTLFCNILRREYVKKSLVFVIKNFRNKARICCGLNICLNDGYRNNGPQIIRKIDPDAIEIMMQIPVSRTIGCWEKRMIHSRSLFILERGLLYGTVLYETLTLARDIQRTMDFIKKKISLKMDERCISDSSEPEIEHFHQLRLSEMKKLFLFSLILLCSSTFMFFWESKQH